MGNSLDNAIFLSGLAEVVAAKVRRMDTDLQRVRANFPGRVEGNPVFQYHEAFIRECAEVEALKVRCRSGTVGDVEVKGRLIETLEALLQPSRHRRAEFERERGLVECVLVAGSERARREVRRAMGLYQLAGA